MLKCLAVGLVLLAFVGCGLGEDDGAQTAVRIVQEFKPIGGAATLSAAVATKLPGGQWGVTKTSESFYRVTYRAATAGQAMELLFGVNINKQHVMALNREALQFTNPH
ncbi:MAG TPA: hypothetical protein VNL69_04365 [Bacteroidota bacterium]|nr:hypothetical protein [Bacteroidota bacterium]